MGEGYQQPCILNCFLNCDCAVVAGDAQVGVSGWRCRAKNRHGCAAPWAFCVEPPARAPSNDLGCLQQLCVLLPPFWVCGVLVLMVLARAGRVSAQGMHVPPPRPGPYPQLQTLTLLVPLPPGTAPWPWARAPPRCPSSATRCCSTSCSRSSASCPSAPCPRWRT